MRKITKLLNAPRERERERESKRLKPFAALLPTTTSPRGRRYKCGQLVAQQLLMRGQKPAFTLAEVLITLAAIGIVAALTIGVFLPKIHSKIRESQIATAEVKFTKAMEQMALNNAIGPYYDNTQEFVDELQNYLKISKVCDKNHLADCMGYDKIKVENGEDIELEYINNGNHFGMPYDNENDFTGDTAGIVTLDGTSMILVWNKKCPILSAGVYEWSGNTNIATSCVAMVMDVNADSKPNKYNKDVVLFNARKLTKCGIEFTYNDTKYCWSEPFKPTPLTNAECEENREKLNISNCCTSTNCNKLGDYWAGAIKMCDDIGSRAPTGEEIAAFANYLYGINKVKTNYTDTPGILNTSRLSATSPTFFSDYAPDGVFYIWSNSERSDTLACDRSYRATYTSYCLDGQRHFKSRFGICVIK